jgi:hypothetical protein
MVILNDTHPLDRLTRRMTGGSVQHDLPRTQTLPTNLTSIIKSTWGNCRE